MASNYLTESEVLERLLKDEKEGDLNDIDTLESEESDEGHCDYLSQATYFFIMLSEVKHLIDNVNH